MKKFLNIIIVVVVFGLFSGCVVNSNYGQQTVEPNQTAYVSEMWNIYKEFDIEVDILSKKEFLENEGFLIITMEHDLIPSATQAYYIKKENEIGFVTLYCFDDSFVASDSFNRAITDKSEVIYIENDAYITFIVRISNQLVMGYSTVLRELLIALDFDVHDAILISERTNIVTEYNKSFDCDKALEYFNNKNCKVVASDYNNEESYYIYSQDGTMLWVIIKLEGQDDANNLADSSAEYFADSLDVYGIEFIYSADNYLLYSVQGMWDEFFETQTADS